MDSKKNQNDEILWIRFIGEDLDGRSVPIYELAQILISIQQIIYKAFLFKEEKSINKKEREKLSLQIVSRKKGSDAYGIAALLMDPTVQDLLKSLLVASIGALAKYVWKKIQEILDGRKRKPAEELSSDDSSSDPMFIASIFMQLDNILKRIDSIGGIAQIEISMPGGATIILNSDTKKYVQKELRNQVFYGEEIEIKGLVTRLNPSRSRKKKDMVLVFVEDVGSVKVYLNPDDFHNIRYHASRETIVTFKGRPRYLFGKESYIRLEEFEADSIEFSR